MEAISTPVAGRSTSDLGEVFPEPPAWVLDLFEEEDPAWQNATSGLAVRSQASRGFQLVSVEVKNAEDLDALTFQDRCALAYELVGERLQGAQARHPVRLWNFIPGILDPLGGLPHRYMVFNAGRFAAFSRWFEGPRAFPRAVPTASGVGSKGTSLLVHCLAAGLPGEPVENPRQISAYHYDRRYGPRPPCFARATRLTGGPNEPARLLVGGTASVRGQDSVHEGDLARQAEETFRNLEALLARSIDLSEACGTPANLLASFRSLRVYHVDAARSGETRTLVESAFPTAEDVEMVNVDLCRPELLIEIEGLAELPTGLEIAASRSLNRGGLPWT